MDFHTVLLIVYSMNPLYQKEEGKSPLKSGENGRFGIIFVERRERMAAFRAQPLVESFSTREIEVLQLISRGSSNHEIAQKLHLSIETVKWYNKQMYMKLGVNNRIQALNKAAELDLLSAEHIASPQEKTAVAGNLPAQLTSYVGREKEIGEIKELLKNNRFMVLTGAGGSGKTRLALKVGDELQDEYRDGVWLVELANIRDPSLVLGTIANVLNIAERADVALDEVLKRFLGRRQLLLLIDNLEHLLECAPLIGELLAAAPQLSVLGTSRERLHIYGEQEYPVHPLNLPDSLPNRTSEVLEDVESIALFIKRARAVYPAFSPKEEALQDLARICVHLDGLPLAIELCAPLVKTFPLKVIAERIESSLDAIPSGPRDLPARQQTLRGAIQWSFDLLEENEKCLFVRMAVFNGGGTLQAVEAICGDGISGNVGNILSALVNKNLVLARERQDGEIHFALLETIRQYSREKLLASGEAKDLADRHAKYFLKLAKRASVELRGPDQIVWTRRMIIERENLRAALAWCIETEATETALRFSGDLFEFWLRHSEFEEGRHWFVRVVSMLDAGQFAKPYTHALNGFVWISFMHGKTEEARRLAERALLLARSQPNKKILATALINLGLMLVRLNGDFSKGQAYLEEAILLSREIQADWELARALRVLATAHSLQNKYSSARSMYSESFNLFKNLGDLYYQGIVKRLIGNLEMIQNNMTKCVEAYRASLRIARAVKSNQLITYNIWELARVAKAKGNHARALRLYLASKKIFDDIGAWWSGDEPELEEALATARSVLGEAEFQSAWEAGQHMTKEEAIGFALGEGLAAE